MFFAFILVPCWLFGMLTILYKLVKNVRKHLRYLVQTWVVVFGGEMLVILFLPPEQLNFLGLQGAKRAVFGIGYVSPKNLGN
jgi:hypothetical protein